MPDTAAAPQSPVSATQRAYVDLRERILATELVPGARLKVDALKEMLSTGASPIREALSLLVSDQLVERIDQRGFRVAPVSAAQFDEVLRLRCALEDMALRESLARGGRVWEEALVLAHHHMSRNARGDVVAFEARHKAFHMALLASCASPILLKFCDRLYDLNIRYRFLAGKSGSYGSRDVAGEHADILASAVDRNADRAAEQLTRHYRVTGQFLAEELARL